jgi:hypothetical protein
MRAWLGISFIGDEVFKNNPSDMIKYRVSGPSYATKDQALARAFLDP